MRLATCFCLAAVSLWAQASDRGCSIAGRLVDAATASPVAEAEVALPDAGPAGRTAETRADGRFVIANLAPGRYRLSAAKDGFGPRGAVVALAGDPCAALIEIRLPRLAVVTGRVFDQDGAPVSRARVAALRPGLAPLASATSDDQGEYRMFGIPPGRYWIRAAPGLPPGPAPDAAAPGGEVYVPTCHPGVTDCFAADPVQLDAGQERRGVDIVLRKQRAVQVLGRVAAPGRTAGIGVTLRNALGVWRQTVSGADGVFAFVGISPGRYVIEAAANVNGGFFRSRGSVLVAGEDVEGVRLTIVPPFEVRGKVRLEGAASLPPLRIGARASELDPVADDADSREAGTDPGGSFVFRDLVPGQYHFTLAGLPDSAYVRSIRFGEVDVLNAGLDLTSAREGVLEIAASSAGGSVSGTIRDGNGVAAPGAVVVVIPQFAGRESRLEFHREENADQNGWFVVDGLAPGEYAVSAWSEDPGALPASPKTARTVTVQPGAAVNLELRASPPAPQL